MQDASVVGEQFPFLRDRRTNSIAVRAKSFYKIYTSLVRVKQMQRKRSWQYFIFSNTKTFVRKIGGGTA